MDFKFPCLDSTCIQVFETQNVRQQTTVAENVMRFYNFVIRKIRKKQQQQRDLRLSFTIPSYITGCPKSFLAIRKW